MILDAFANWPLYFGLPAWRAAFAWVAAQGPDLALGEHPIDGPDIYARVFSYQTRPRESVVLEAHRDYVDIQIPLAGGELQGRYDLAGLTVKTPYDPAKDIEFFEHPAPYVNSYALTAGMFVAYFPQDAHMTQTIRLQPEPVKKVVVKVRAALLRP